MAERRGIPPPKKDRKEYNEAQELESLQRVFDRLDRKADKKIDAEELFEYLKFLGHKCKKAEVEDMIWEVVDEDCDRCVAWDEFKTMCAVTYSMNSAQYLRDLLEVQQLVECVAIRLAVIVCVTARAALRGNGNALLSICPRVPWLLLQVLPSAER
eukprot:3809515-Pleurochrysis_carterae.AAC.1